MAAFCNFEVTIGSFIHSVSLNQVFSEFRIKMVQNFMFHEMKARNIDLKVY